MDPGRGSSSAASRLPSSNCFSSSKRSKREEGWMTEMWPRSSVRVLTDATGGGGPDGTGATGERCASSKTPPARNFVGKVSGVVLNNLCPRSQNPFPRQNVIFVRRAPATTQSHTCFEVCRNGVRRRPPVVDNLSHFGTYYPGAKVSVRSRRQTLRMS